MNESDRRQRVISSTPRLSADEVANHSFAKGVRGFSETEVRAFLKRVSEELALAPRATSTSSSRRSTRSRSRSAPRARCRNRSCSTRSARRRPGCCARRARRATTSARRPKSAPRGWSTTRTPPRIARAPRPPSCSRTRTRRGRGQDGRSRRRGRSARRGRRSTPATCEAEAILDERAAPGPRDARRGEVGARARARRSRAPPRVAERADRGVARPAATICSTRTARSSARSSTRPKRSRRSRRAPRSSARRRAASRSTSPPRSRPRSRSSTVTGARRVDRRRRRVPTPATPTRRR